MLINYKISAIWEPRIERPEEIVARFRKLISLLQSIDPITQKWFHVNPEGACFDVDALGERLIDTIIGRVAKGDFGEPAPWMGYNLIAYNHPSVSKTADGLWLSGNVGSQCQSELTIFTNDGVTPVAPVVAYNIFKSVVFAVLQAFEPDWVKVAPNDLYANLDMSRYKRPPMLAGWMIALSSPIADLIKPPAGIISERLSDGSLFMAATDETFVTGNPVHMAATGAIQAVVDPLNYTVPFQSLIDWTDPTK